MLRKTFLAFFLCLIFGTNFTYAGPHDANSEIPIHWKSYDQSFSNKIPTTDSNVFLFFPGRGNGGENVFHTAYIYELQDKVALVKVDHDNDTRYKEWGVSIFANKPTVVVLDKHGNIYKFWTHTFNSRDLQSAAETIDKYYKDVCAKLQREYDRIEKNNEKRHTGARIRELKSKIIDKLKGYDVVVKASQLYSVLLGEGMVEINSVITSDEKLQDKKKKLQTLLTPYTETEAFTIIKSAIKDLDQEIEDTKKK